MPELTDTRRKLKTALATLLAIDVVAAAVWLSPLVGSERSRREQLDQLWKDLQLKTRQVEPLRGLDKKVVVARQQIDEFYKQRLPEQESAIASDLGKVAAESGVRIGQVKYKVEDAEPIGLRPVQIEADFSGDYLQLVRFINSLERDQLFFIVNSVDLGGEQGGVVKLQMKLQTFLKPGA